MDFETKHTQIQFLKFANGLNVDAIMLSSTILIVSQKNKMEFYLRDSQGTCPRADHQP